MIDDLLRAIAEAPTTQIDKYATKRISDLVGEKDRADKMKDILDDCARNSLATDFAMVAMDAVWKEMLKEEGKDATLP